MFGNRSPIQALNHTSNLGRSGLATLLLAAAALGYVASCQSQPLKTRPKASASASATSPRADAPARNKIEALFKRDEKSERDEAPEAASDSGKKGTKKLWVIDNLVDVGPAGPAAASARGVVIVSKESGVRLAALARTQAGNAPVPTPVTAIDAEPKEFVSRARGPAVVGNEAYFVDGTNLVRQDLDGGPKVVLAADARPYTQVASSNPSRNDPPAMVAYIAVSPTDTQSMIARLWVQGQGSKTLSPEGTTANSVALAQQGSGWVALSLEGRTGMSPLHARRIELTATSVHLGPDIIAWVAGSAQPMTLVRGISDETNLWAFIPIERDISRFGLARVHVSDTPNQNQEVHWRNYPNGIEPAPMTTGRICGQPVVLYARPSAATPHAPQELHLAPVIESALGTTTLIGTSRAFSDVSLAVIDGGALIVYVADHRTWARRLRCAR